MKVNFLLIMQSPPALSALFISCLIYYGDSVRERYFVCPDRILLITDILTMTVAPCVGHTGRRNLIAYIGLDDALDRNREAVIVFFFDTGSTCLEGGVRALQCVCVSLISPDTRPTYATFFGNFLIPDL